MSGPVGGRLSSYWKNWQFIKAESWVTSVLHKGYYLPIQGRVPLTSSPPNLGYAPSHPLFQELRDQVVILLEKHAVEQVTESSPGFYSRLFLAPKKGGEWRPVIDLSALNRFMTAPHFKMETTASILEATTPGLWATSLDLKDAFFHIMIAPSHRKFLRFTVDGVHYQFRALPFGLTTSPYVFTRILKPIAAFARALGLDLYLYLDDWVLLSKSSHAAEIGTRWLLQLARALGLVVNIPKCDLDPAQVYEFIGILFDLVVGTAQPAPHWLEAFLTLARQFLDTDQLPAVKWQQLLGHMTSLEKLVPRGRLHMRPLQYCLRDQWTASQSPDHLVTLSEEARVALQWWSHRPHLVKGVSLHHSTPEVRLFTDASTQGWGAHIGADEVGKPWPSSLLLKHINFLELKAVILALHHFQSQIQGRHVIVMTDNMTTVGHIKNQGGTHSRELFSLTRELFLWVDSHHVTLTAQHIPGHLNVVADRLSRAHQVLPGEWSLCPQVTRQLWRLWGQPHIDLFATADNAKLPLYASPLPDPSAWAIDALSFSWSQMSLYAFPPIPLLRQVLEKVLHEPCQMILIAPAWPTQSWFPLLLRLSIDHPRLLPPHRHLLKQPRRNLFHDNPQHLLLHAWRLSSQPCDNKVSQKRWLAGSPSLTEPARGSFMTAGGTFSVAGAGTLGNEIHSLPLYPS